MAEKRAKVMDLLTDIISRQQKQASTDAPTSHPVGNADDGDQPASEGAFAKTNMDDSKQNAGPAGVDSADGNVTKEQPMHTGDAQQELNPGDVTDPPPNDIKPKKTVAAGDDDTDKSNLGGSESDAAKSANAVLGELDEFLKEASDFLPEEETADASESGAGDTPAEGADAAGGEDAPGGEEAPAGDAGDTAAAEGGEEAPAEDDTVTEEQAAALLEEEKGAAVVVSNILKSQGIAEDASINEKRAALVAAFQDGGIRAGAGFVASQDEEVLDKLIKGEPIEKSAEDTSDAMPPSVPTDASAGAAVPDTGGAGDVAGGAAAGGVDPAVDPQVIIQAILQAIESGQLTPEDAAVLLSEAGVDEATIAEILGAVGGGAPAASPDAAAAAAPAAPAASAEDVAPAGEPAKMAGKKGKGIDPVVAALFKSAATRLRQK